MFHIRRPCSEQHSIDTFCDFIDNFDYVCASCENAAKLRYIFTLVYVAIVLIICHMFSKYCYQGIVRRFVSETLEISHYCKNAM